MAGNKEHYRHIMLYYYRKGRNASEARKKICAVYGDNAIESSTCRKWFKRFRENNFNVSDAPRTGRPPETDVDQIMALIESNEHKSTREIGKILGINQSTVSRQLRQLQSSSKTPKKTLIRLPKREKFMWHGEAKTDLAGQSSKESSEIGESVTEQLLESKRLGNEEKALEIGPEKVKACHEKNKPSGATDYSGS